MSQGETVRTPSTPAPVNADDTLVAASEETTPPAADQPATPQPTTPHPRSGAWWRALTSEWRLIFTRRRNVLLLAGLAALPLLIGIAVKLYTHGDATSLPGRIAGSGMFLAAVAFAVSMPVFLPIVIAVVAGDSLSGEAQAGTVRYAMIVPVSRTKWLAMKAAGVFLFVIVAAVVMFVVALVVGFALFGVRDLTLLSGDTVGVGNGIARMAGVAVYAILSLTGLCAVGLFISSLTEVPLAAMAGTALVPVISTVCVAIPQLAVIQPGLLTYHWLDLTTFLFAQPDWGLLQQGLWVQAAWVVIFGALAWARVASADVTA